MKYVYLDCEFLREDFHPSGLVSIGITSGNDSYYAVNQGMDIRALHRSEWMTQNVLPHLPTVSYGSSSDSLLDLSHPDVWEYGQIREDVSSFFASISLTGNATDDIKLSAWCGGQDLVRLHGMWRHDWSVMPSWIPRYIHDIQEDIVDSGIHEGDLPQQDPQTVHHALFDAQHDEVLHQFLRGRMA